jgi:hypothetical protein
MCGANVSLVEATGDLCSTVFTRLFIISYDPVYGRRHPLVGGGVGRGCRDAAPGVPVLVAVLSVSTRQDAASTQY